MKTLTLDEAAELLKTTPETVSEKIRHEGLPATRVGRAYVLVDVDVIEWVRRRRTRRGRSGIPRIGDTNALIAAFKPEAAIVARPRLPHRAPEREGVYFLIAGGRVVYVGSSTNIRTRIADHASNGRPFERCAWTLTQPSLRLALESLHIALWRPPGNRVCGRLPRWALHALSTLSGERPCF